MLWNWSFETVLNYCLRCHDNIQLSSVPVLFWLCSCLNFLGNVFFFVFFFQTVPGKMMMKISFIGTTTYLDRCFTRFPSELKNSCILITSPTGTRCDPTHLLLGPARFFSADLLLSPVRKEEHEHYRC